MPLKIAVITPRFAIAGVPLAQIRFAGALSRAGHDVEMLVGFIEPDFQFLKPDGIQIRNLEKENVRGMLISICKYLLEQKPDIIFSAEDHLNCIVLIAAILTRSRVKISGSSRVTPFDTYSNLPFSKGWLLKNIAKLVMHRADALTCVSKEMIAQYHEVFIDPPHQCIYNIVVDSQASQKMLEEVAHPWINNSDIPLLVAAGKLSPWKGFHDLIYAVKELDEIIDLRLLILGDGPLRKELNNLIHELGLQDKIALLGFVNNPLKYFFQADIFVLSSHVEGLPNVLVEAMMCGCTPVATDCPTGPKEVLQNGEYGYLAETKNPSSIAKQIKLAIENPIAPSKLREAITPFHESEVLSNHFKSLNIRP